MLQYPLNDIGNAQRFAAKFTGKLAYARERKNGWFLWSGSKWEPDLGLEHERLAMNLIQGMRAELNDGLTEHERAQLLTHIDRSSRVERVKAMISLARPQKGLSMSLGDFDNSPIHLNTEGGIIDLSKPLKPPVEALPAHWCTKFVPIPWDSQAKCPLWAGFIETITQGDRDLATYLQKAIGYTMTGLTREQCFFVLYGTGRNGKGTFLRILNSLLGTYGITWDQSSITLQRNLQAGAARPDIARLPGIRCVTIGEVKDNLVLDEVLIKSLTGEDKITARALYTEPFDFLPQAKLWIATNYRPQIKDGGFGLWRRVRAIPFTTTIPDEDIDPLLGAKLQAELPGIFQWALQGLEKWWLEGLKVPQAILDDTQAYQREEDSLKAFVDEHCHRNPKEAITPQDFYLAYTAFCTKEGKRPITKKRVSNRIGEFGLTSQIRKIRGRAARIWVGTRLKTEEELLEGLPEFHA